MPALREPAGPRSPVGLCRKTPILIERMTMRGRVVLGMVIVVGAISAGPSVATTPRGTWTLSAVGSHSTQLRLASQVALDIPERQQDIGTGRRSIDSVLRIQGRYGGMVIRDGAGNVWAGLLRYADAGSLIGWGRYTDENRQVLPPGSYTVTVFGDRSTWISFGVRGSGNRRLLPRQPALVKVSDQHGRELAHGFVPAEMSAPVTVGRHTAYAIVGTVAAPLPGADYEMLCVSPAESFGCVDWAQMYAKPGGCACQNSTAEYAIFAGPSDVAPGSYLARFTHAQAGPATYRALFTAVFD